MPKGCVKPVAYISTVRALPSAPTPRSTRMRPGSLSDTSGFPLRHEQIAIGRAPDEPRILQTRDVLGDGESRQGLRPGIRGPWDDMRAAVRRLRTIWLRQVR